MNNKIKRVAKKRIKDIFDSLKDFDVNKEVLHELLFKTFDDAPDIFDQIHKNALNIKINSYQFTHYKQYDKNVIGCVFELEYEIKANKKVYLTEQEIRSVNGYPTIIFINELILKNDENNNIGKQK